MIFLFSDDCVILVADHSFKNLEKIRNEELIKIKDSYDAKILSTGFEKSKFMIFKPKNRKKLKHP